MSAVDSTAGVGAGPHPLDVSTVLDPPAVHARAPNRLRFADPATEERYGAWRFDRALPLVRTGMAAAFLGGWLIIGVGVLVDPGVAVRFAPAVITSSPLFLVTVAVASTRWGRRYLSPTAAAATAVWGGAMVWAVHAALAAPGLGTTAVLLVSFFAVLVFRLPPGTAVLPLTGLAALHTALLLTTDVPVDAGAAFHITVTAAVVIASLLVGVVAEHVDRTQFRLGEVVEAQRVIIDLERARSTALLRNAMPAAIAARLLTSSDPVVDRHDSVTVLFADVVGFTSLFRMRSAAEVVALLDDTFSRLDDLAERHGVTKVKTIGDAYMAVAGAPDPRPDHAEAVIEMALDLLEVVRELSEAQPHDLQVRIGVATGEAVAGVIGRTRYAYDLWSSTVNLASRMESHGVPGHIQVTAETAGRLGRAYALRQREELLDVDGVGPTPTWFVEGRRA